MKDRRIRPQYDYLRYLVTRGYGKARYMLYMDRNYRHYSRAVLRRKASEKVFKVDKPREAVPTFAKRKIKHTVKRGW